MGLPFGMVVSAVWVVWIVTTPAAELASCISNNKEWLNVYLIRVLLRTGRQIISDLPCYLGALSH